MGLADDLAGIDPVSTRSCPVAAVLDNLDLADHAALVAVLARPKEEVPGTKITALLRSHGHILGRDAVGQHRRKACGCVTE